MSEQDIVYENGEYWVLKKDASTYEVYKNELTHSVRCAIIGYPGHIGLQKAIDECNRRALIEIERRGKL